MLLTVIIVTKNPGNEIYPTLSSIMSLNDPEVEILIKDNSSDRTLENINDSFHFLNFRYIHSDDDGVYDAMNQAVKQAKGGFLYFLNAGDQYIECNLLSILKTDTNSVDFHYGNIIALRPYLRLVHYSRFINKYSVYLKRLCHQAIVFRKSVFDELGMFDTNLEVNADYLFTLHLIKRFKGHSLNRFIALYKGGGLSYNHKLSDHKKAYLKDQISKIFNPPEIWLLQIASVIVSFIVYLKNINKPK